MPVVGILLFARGQLNARSRAGAGPTGESMVEGRNGILLVSTEFADISPFDIVDHVTAAHVVEQRGHLPHSGRLAIIDMRGGTRHDVIVSALLLRNRGTAVVVCDLGHVPHDLVRNVLDFVEAAQSEKRQVRPEVLLTEDAMGFLGDIADVVRYFEREFLV
jgi:hypothetical protein